jgi:hypothetical protein
MPPAARGSMLLHPIARPRSFPMLQTSSQSPKRVHAPHARGGSNPDGSEPDKAVNLNLP